MHSNRTTNISTTRTPSLPEVSDQPAQNITFKMYTMKPATPDWRPTECTHVFSGYIVPNLLHFIAFILGLYHFRIQESEGFQALIEMVSSSSSWHNYKCLFIQQSVSLYLIIVFPD